MDKKRVIRAVSGLSLLALLVTSATGAVQAQEPDESLTPVCVSSFEAPIRVEYLTDEQIAAIEATVDDGTDIPPPKIVGYPDPETGSCATVNGELKDYDPEYRTPICVPSGPERDGPLVVVLAINHYLGPNPNPDVILADPVTGACPDQADGDDTAALVEALVEKLKEVLRELLR